MKKKLKLFIGLLSLGASAWMLTAQDGPRSGEHRLPPPDGPPAPGMHRHPPPPPPIIEALDANHDGVIDASEIANANKALLKLDKNGDGKLTRDELRPPPTPDDFDGPPPFDDDMPPPFPPPRDW